MLELREELSTEVLGVVCGVGAVQDVHDLGEMEQQRDPHRTGEAAQQAASLRGAGKDDHQGIRQHQAPHLKIHMIMFRTHFKTQASMLN